MLIRHTPCFLLLPPLDHPVTVVLAPFVAALVPVVGLATRPTPTPLVLAVRAPVIARTADDELVPAPPAHDPPRVRSHRSPWANAENFVKTCDSCDLSHAPLARGSGRYPGPLLFCRRSLAYGPTAPGAPYANSRRLPPVTSGARGPGDRGGSGTRLGRWRQAPRRVRQRSSFSLPPTAGAFHRTRAFRLTSFRLTSMTRLSADWPLSRQDSAGMHGADLPLPGRPVAQGRQTSRASPVLSEMGRAWLASCVDVVVLTRWAEVFVSDSAP
jgi:hypothetical protein